MSRQVRITVFPRLDCCLPDFTGKNRALSQLLAQTQQTLGQRVRIQVVGTTTRPERVDYYQGMVQALRTAGWTFPADIDLASLPQDLPPILGPGLRRLSLHLFGIAPVIAVEGKAVFVGEVPSLDAFTSAIEQASRVDAERAAI